MTTQKHPLDALGAQGFADAMCWVDPPAAECKFPDTCVLKGAERTSCQFCSAPAAEEITEVSVLRAALLTFAKTTVGRERAIAESLAIRADQLVESQA